MDIQFYKYQGAGNDFIMIDDREEQFDHNNVQLIAKMCDRHFGIGGDGLILLRDDTEHDFKMIYFNADGREGTMCGNGGRCIVRFAHDLGACPDLTTFNAIDGVHTATVTSEVVKLQMGDVIGYESSSDHYFLDTGSPHYISFVTDLSQMDVFQEGKKIRYNDRFAEKGTNVNFVEIKDDKNIFVRTYERGVENETYACGTGVTAAAISSYLEGETSNDVNIEVLGGMLMVSFKTTDNNTFKDIFLTGPAERVFEGIY